MPTVSDRIAAEQAIPHDANEAALTFGARRIRLTNLRKVFWPRSGITKGDLLRYYHDVAPVLVPHLHGRPMVMKRYPNGIEGSYFFMKRVPEPHPAWLTVCPIEHRAGNVIAFPVVDDVASLLYLVNLGCIDLNPWYGACGAADRPDYLHFDLDPGDDATFVQVRETALVVRAALERLGMPVYVKTSGATGLHVYVPIEPGPTQKQVWTFAKAFAHAVAREHADLATAEYRLAQRPRDRVLVDYNQNAYTRTLASVYSVRPRARAPVSTPLRWCEVERGVEPTDFRIDNIRERLAEMGDLWKPMLSADGRFALERLLS